MGAAGQWEISGHHALVGGAVLHPLDRQRSPVNDRTVTFTVHNVTAAGARFL